MGFNVRRAGLFVFLIACHSDKPTVTSDTPTASASVSVNVSASASAASGPALGPATGHVALGATGTIDENKVYSVDGTTLRFMLKNAMRATPISGGHVWSGMLTVCEGRSTCTELGLSGPDQPPAAWRGFELALTFVMPTSLTITRK